MKKSEVIARLIANKSEDQNLFEMVSRFEHEVMESKKLSGYSATKKEMKNIFAQHCFSAMTGKVIAPFLEYGE